MMARHQCYMPPLTLSLLNKIYTTCMETINVTMKAVCRHEMLQTYHQTCQEKKNNGSQDKILIDEFLQYHFGAQ